MCYPAFSTSLTGHAKGKRCIARRGALEERGAAAVLLGGPAEQAAESQPNGTS
jgi:hypothetical protein